MKEILTNHITTMDEAGAVKAAEEMIHSGVSAIDVLDACQEALDIIGKRFEAEEAFIPELIMSGEIMGKVSSIIKPHLKGDLEAGNAGLFHQPGDRCLEAGDRLGGLFLGGDGGRCLDGGSPFRAVA